MQGTLKMTALFLLKLKLPKVLPTKSTSSRRLCKMSSYILHSFKFQLFNLVPWKAIAFRQKKTLGIARLVLQTFSYYSSCLLLLCLLLLLPAAVLAGESGGENTRAATYVLDRPALGPAAARRALACGRRCLGQDGCTGYQVVDGACELETSGDQVDFKARQLDCHSDFVAGPFTHRHVYLVTRTHLRVQRQVLDHCLNLGSHAHGVAIGSADENEFIYQMALREGCELIYTGGFAFPPGQKKDFFWTLHNATEPFSYKNWYIGEPNNPPGLIDTEDAVVMRADAAGLGRWANIMKDTTSDTWTNRHVVCLACECVRG